MRVLTILPLFILGGCLDYEFSSSDDLREPILDTGYLGSSTTPDDDTGPGDTSADDTAGGGGGHGDSGGGGVEPPDDDRPDADDPPQGDPPDRYIDDDCKGGVDMALSPDLLVVLSWDPTTDEGTLSAPSRGYFDLYDTTIAESGTSQWNETAYLRVSNTLNPSGAPNWGNCGSDWVVQDADNHGFPSGSLIYLGTFWLEKGDNKIVLMHYCERQRAGECPGLHITDDSDSTCASGSANSVHVEAQGLCARSTGR